MKAVFTTTESGRIKSAELTGETWHVAHAIGSTFRSIDAMDLAQWADSKDGTTPFPDPADGFMPVEIMASGDWIAASIDFGLDGSLTAAAELARACGPEYYLLARAMERVVSAQSDLSAELARAAETPQAAHEPVPIPPPLAPPPDGRDYCEFPA